MMSYWNGGPWANSCQGQDFSILDSAQTGSWAPPFQSNGQNESKAIPVTGREGL
jgi:hypothetical protein